MSIQSINPATGETLETFSSFSKEQIDDTLDAARRAYEGWRETSFAARSAHLHAVAAYLRDHEAALARTATCEMGKPIV
ncbi:MAG TPA: aldehyde dehydrogenase family protein, partial [Ktedonobacterales bacterium]|nr:aldehyde dehydrogenase family protein [Ktedonobacterales bacterium]